VVNFAILSRYSTEAVKSNLSNRSYNLKVLPPLSIPQIFIGVVSEYYCHENFYAFVIRDIVLRELLVFATGPLIFNRNDLVVILRLVKISLKLQPRTIFLCSNLRMPTSGYQIGIRMERNDSDKVSI
jgi:hypothetical protein